MKMKLEIVITLGGLSALLLWAKPHIDANTATSGDAFTDFMVQQQSAVLTGPEILIAAAIVGAFGWWTVTQEKRLNGCLGPVALLVLGAAAMAAISMIGGG